MRRQAAPAGSDPEQDPRPAVESRAAGRGDRARLAARAQESRALAEGRNQRLDWRLGCCPQQPPSDRAGRLPGAAVATPRRDRALGAEGGLPVSQPRNPRLARRRILASDATAFRNSRIGPAAPDSRARNGHPGNRHGGHPRGDSPGACRPCLHIADIPPDHERPRLGRPRDRSDSPTVPLPEPAQRWGGKETRTQSMQPPTCPRHISPDPENPTCPGSVSCGSGRKLLPHWPGRRFPPSRGIQVVDCGLWSG